MKHVRKMFSLGELERVVSLIGFNGKMMSLMTNYYVTTDTWTLIITISHYFKSNGMLQ